VEIKSLEWMMSQEEELPLSSSKLTSTGLQIHILIPRKKLGFVMVTSYLLWSALKWNLWMKIQLSRNFTVYYVHSQIHKYRGLFNDIIYICVLCFVKHSWKLTNSTYTL
jgi:hypothetical protein